MMSNGLVERLREIVGSDNVYTTEAERALHSTDQSSYAHALPDVVVYPASTAEVSQLVATAHGANIPVVGWGAGTSLEGQPVPTHGGMVIDFRRMAAIIEVHAKDFQVTVQPGVLYRDMNKVLAKHGLFFAPDPGANASIGGMIANNAAGTRTVKYGATRDNVLALEVVLADGSVIKTGSRSVKQSAGYDLTHLIVGSEGTLGLVTAATLKLAPLPEHFSAITAAFPSVEAAAEAVYGIMGAALNPAALELLDAPTIGMLKEEVNFEIVEAPNLFIEFNGASEAGLAADLELAEAICRECGCTDFRSGLGREAHAQLWEVRHRAFEILVQHHPGLQWIVTDVAVPISDYPALVHFANETSEALGFSRSLIGHAGDGNLHTALFFDAEGPGVREKVREFTDQLVSKALSFGGTCTGEHGVGLGKRKYLVYEYGEGTVELMKQIKTLLDPQNILNPGKVVDIGG